MMRRMRRILALVVLLTLLPAVAAEARPDAATRICRAQDRFLVDLRATGLRCDSARRVSLRWARTDACFRTTSSGAVRARACRLRGAWSCTPRRLEGRGARIRCRTAARTVSFTSTEA
jgi:hypothetical protein